MIMRSSSLNFENRRSLFENRKVVVKSDLKINKKKRKQYIAHRQYSSKLVSRLSQYFEETLHLVRVQKKDLQMLRSP